jgi:uncharacterized protein (DUF2126 family)/transglutaminase-like putative cysteine protease
MAIRVALHHTTRYTYERPVIFSPHVVRLRPAPHSRTPIEAYSLKAEPEHFLNWQQDPFGNYVARLVFHEPAKELKVEVDLVANLVTINPFDFFLEESAEKVPVTYDDVVKKELGPYLELPETGPRFEQLARRVEDDLAREGRRTIDLLVDVNQLVQRTLRYDIRMEPGVFSPEETLERGHGSCRDFAWLLVCLLRRLGLAARFVSGYSIQLVADQKPIEGPVGVSSDVTDLHAWAEVYLPGAGWIGLDATSGLWCGEGHIPLACTPQPSTAAPIEGSFGYAKAHEDDEIECEFEVKMSVTRIEDRPRPTKSYTDAQWAAILACGDAVEKKLVARDVRLTMGGEPTFVSVDDMEGAEWNTAALGPTKAILADALARRLLARFAPGGVLHHGQGKWYPGEPLPRWAYSLYWRDDGEAVWRDPARIATSGEGHRAEIAEALVRSIAQKLGVDPSLAIDAYEDVWYYLWRERNLPANVDPFDNKLEDEQERARLHRVFEQGLKTIVGYALPLAIDERDHWISGRWHLRDERMYLLPGDSAMGFRLPLDSLPWSVEGDAIIERDPFAPRTTLPRREALRQTRGRVTTSSATRGSPASGVVRTALCVEPRDGMLHVFLPPLAMLEQYLALIAAIEDSAEELGVRLRLEGYPPPRDPRLHQLSVTPDPGVIEVNVHPARSWQHAVELTTALYEEARATRLGTDKFMVDGRHTGTGGGNHVVIGGATPDDSPILRRPDLLRSLVSYWVNHPSLAYLFSGLFVGPTSQAPRIDEARNDSLYELDVAFAALKKQITEQDGAPPWFVDRVFRHLLVDVTGNTHRAEQCMDKLYSPDSASGRQGLLELRGFEMPPDARMSCAQQLLVRALIAWFWETPYERPLVRWGTQLHDRFMLPHFLWEDISDVVGDLSRAGMPLEDAWFAPHWEFRFPKIGSIAARGVELELRQAVEPWHVLGEEQTGGGTARYVDSSLERVQILARGLIDPRHVVTCNGRRVPLHPTGRAGERVAGVRFKAWKPPSSLHPTLDVDAPLTIDVVDTWNDRAIGGCTYAVSHPGGRAFDVYPKNGLEAESRRASRFAPIGHSPGPVFVPHEERSLEHPLTLDLRK